MSPIIGLRILLSLLCSTFSVVHSHYVLRSRTPIMVLLWYVACMGVAHGFKYHLY